MQERFLSQMDLQCVDFYTSILNGDVNLEDFSMQNSQSEFTSGYAQQYEVSTQSGSSSGRGKRKSNFSPEEDDLLVSAWLNISQDAIHSTDQKVDKYWKRVHEFFHRNKKFVSKRSSISLMNRWSVIQKAINKFCGCYAQIEGRKQSGMTEHDKILHAKAMYTEIYGGAFLLENCWNRLRSEPKWLVNGDKSTTTKKKSNKQKRKKDDVSSLEDSIAPSDINLEDKDSQDPSSVKKPRPSGKKQEQEKIKNKKSKEELDDTIVELMKEIKEERKNSKTVKMELLEKLLEIEEKKEEERIMSIDVAGMSQLQAEYYIQRQKNIMEKLKEGK